MEAQREHALACLRAELNEQHAQDLASKLQQQRTEDATVARMEKVWCWIHVCHEIDQYVLHPCMPVCLTERMNEKEKSERVQDLSECVHSSHSSHFFPHLHARMF